MSQLWAQETDVHCYFDSTHLEKDDIIRGIELGDPTIHIHRDTLSPSNYRLKLNTHFEGKVSSRTLWAEIRSTNGKKRKLVNKVDYEYDCANSELIITNQELLCEKTIIEIRWICS
ncbi:MAG TPA: hypothetical protein DIW47_13255 [Bacteroidetes bacterium]|nr:hypothetical protein [Bacteroidota bacterium]